MHVAVLQSAYVPWRGYFDIIASVDLFLLYDDVQYSKGSWRNRNKVKTADGSKWMTVPVNVSLGQSIADVDIAYGPKDWIAQHRGLLSQGLSDTRYYAEAIAPWNAEVEQRPASLSELNTRLLRAYAEELGISTPFASSGDYQLEGSATDRLIMLLKAVGATSYLSGPSAEAYLKLDMFRDAGIDLYYKSYVYDPYPQPWGAFQADVSVIDLIANLGPEAAAHVRSRTADRKVAL